MNIKQRPIFNFLFSVLVLILSIPALNATHIVGGEMNYTCLGNNTFQVKLTIYRDCFYADPGAFFDNPAHIGVFNSNNIRLNQLQLPLLNNDTIPAILTDSCLFVPADVCVHTTTYMGTIQLPYIPGGYQLAYERCCRNETSLNIADPLNAGAAYNIFITEQSLLGCNNSAKFTEWPPLFVCVNEPIDWDHSALDIDGDSLVYELCTPLSGGSQADPKPVPTNNPPYPEVVWNEPAFSLDNLLGGANPLTIDSKTGRLTALPTIMGQFVVGVCVSEYRNGVLLSKTRRDFQYNVGECGEVIAAIVAPQVQCEDLSVSFTNNSIEADGFLWNFNDPNNPNAISSEVEPTYVYQDTGTFTIQLISSAKTVCRDTSYHTIYLQRNSMKADFAVNLTDCMDNSTLKVTDLSIDSVSSPAAWDWQLKVDGILAETSTLQNPEFSITSPAGIELTLTTTSENGCVDGTTKTFNAVINDPADDIASNILVCIGLETQLNPDFNPSFTYQWASNPLFTDLDNPNPTVIASQDVDLQVTIVDNNNACTGSKTVQLRVANIPAINDIPDQVIICSGASAQLNSVEYPNLIFNWSGEGLDDPGSDTPIATPTQTTTYTVNITDTNQNNCGLSKQVEVVVNPNPDDVVAAISNDAIVCFGDQLALNPSNNTNFNYNWSGTDIGNPSEVNPIINPGSSGTYAVTVTNPNTGCTSSKTFEITAPQEIALNVNGDPNICFGNTRLFEANGNGNLLFSWSDGNGQVLSSGGNLNYDLDINNDLTILATNSFGCTETTGLEVVVNENPDNIVDGISGDVIVCFGDQIALNPNGNSNFNYSWTGSDIVDINAVNPTFIPSSSGTYGVTVTNPNTGCESEKNFIITAPEEIALNINGDPNLCFGGSRLFEASGTGDLSFSWSDENAQVLSSASNLNYNLTTSNNLSILAVNSFGCQETTSLEVIVNENPDNTIDGISDDVLVCFGEQIALNPGGNPSFNYSWSGLDIINTNAVNPTFIPTASGTYSVTVTNPNTSCVSDKSFVITAPEEIGLNVNGDPEICFGDARIYTASGNGFLSYSWTNSSGLELSNAANLNYDLNIDNNLTIVATDNFGCQESTSLNIKINENPDDILSLVASDHVVCKGVGVALNTNGNPSFDYNWGGDLITNPSVINPVIRPTVSGNYAVTITNPNTGCESSKIIGLTVPDDINLDVVGDRNLCHLESEIFEASGNQVVLYRWISQDGAILSNNSTLQYDLNISNNITVEAANSFGCDETTILEVEVADRIIAVDNIPDSVLVCENVPTSLSTNTGNQYEYLWSPNIHIDDNTSENPIFSAVETTIYTVEIVDPNSGCMEMKNIQAVVPAGIDLNLTDDITTCGDEQIQLIASSTIGESYSWISETGASLGTSNMIEVNPRESGRYILEVVDQFGCILVDSVRVNYTGIDARIGADDIETCDDEVQLMLSNVPIGDQNAYTWSPQEAILSGANSSNPIVINDTNDPITFSVTITNEHGCQIVDQAVLRNRFDLDGLSVTGINACADVGVELNPDFNPSYDYSWSPANALDDPNSPNPTFIPTESQEFTVTITDADGCSTIRDVSVLSVDIEEMVNISITNDTILTGQSIQLEVTFDPDFTYSWGPATGLSNNAVNNPIASPTESISYTVMVQNSQGCITTESVTLTVLSSDCVEPFVFFPNAFTPNGDGINDVLRVRGNGITEVLFIIYDRWGEKIFEGNSVDDAWDGTYKGKRLAPDVFGFYLEAKCIFGGEYKKQGNVTILD